MGLLGNILAKFGVIILIGGAVFMRTVKAVMFIKG